MRQGRARRTLVVVLAVCAFGSGAEGQMFVTTGRDTLRGLLGVEVAVEDLPPELARSGLTAEAIREAVVARLKANGIVVYASQTENPSPAKPYVYVHVNALELPRNAGFVVGVQVHLRQTLRSLITESNIVNAMTWETHNVLSVPAGELAEVRTEILDFVDLFVKDWRAVHP